ncbi:MAG TPA: signal peptidase II [Sphingomonas sp.]|jgi:signal peptidase II|uniref:signal peptidase II n=1 Tax=Sphingomonas sp. TaxID=28214 RepID=UPI002ED9EBEC
MTRPRPLGYVIAIAVFLIDQISKWYVVERLRLPDLLQIRVLPILDLTWVRNFGVSMGLLTASTDVARWLLVAMTGLIAGGVAVWLWRERKTPDMLALGLVLGGALGNILDRVRLGYVADFLDLHFGVVQPFLVFNVADAAITVGVLLLLLRAFLTRDGADRSENVHA